MKVVLYWELLKRFPEIVLIRELVKLYLKAYEGHPEYSYSDPEDVEHYIKWLLGERRRKRTVKPLFMIAIERGEEVVGFIAGDPQWYDRSLGEVVNIHELVVSPDRRRKGLARRLIYEFCKLAHDISGLDKAILWVAESNYPAINLYHKLGFEEVRRAGIWILMKTSVHQLLKTLEESIR